MNLHLYIFVPCQNCSSESFPASLLTFSWRKINRDLERTSFYSKSQHNHSSTLLYILHSETSLFWSTGGRTCERKAEAYSASPPHCPFGTDPGWAEEIQSAAGLSMIHNLQASILKCHFYWSPFDVPFAFPRVDELCLWHFPNSRPWKSEFKWALKTHNQMKYQLNKTIWMHIN